MVRGKAEGEAATKLFYKIGSSMKHKTAVTNANGQWNTSFQPGLFHYRQKLSKVIQIDALWGWLRVSVCGIDTSWWKFEIVVRVWKTLFFFLLNSSWLFLNEQAKFLMITYAVRQYTRSYRSLNLCLKHEKIYWIFGIGTLKISKLFPKNSFKRVFPTLCSGLAVVSRDTSFE